MTEDNSFSFQLDLVCCFSTLLTEHSKYQWTQQCCACDGFWYEQQILATIEHISVLSAFFLSVLVNGGYSSWEPFGQCSKTCGGGVQRRIRTCSNPSPQNEGEDCNSLGPAFSTRKCKNDECQSKEKLLLSFITAHALTLGRSEPCFELQKVRNQYSPIQTEQTNYLQRCYYDGSFFQFGGNSRSTIDKT